MKADPRLSICVPTYQRPDLLARALGSALQGGARAGEVEVLVSDNSMDARSSELARDLLNNYPGPGRYVLNRPGVGAVPNFNRCRELATGEYVLILHDDDYLLPGAVDSILDATAPGQPDHPVLLFGTHVVGVRGEVRRRQVFRTERYLPPKIALTRLLSNSSFVRFPAIVVHRDAYEQTGPFNVEVRNPTDFEMWIRLFTRYGVRCMPAVTCAYTVHAGALTEEMFKAGSVDTLMGIFEKVARDGPLTAADMRRLQSDFFHQWVLAGASRRLRLWDRAGARQILGLFRLPSVRALGLSPKWAPVRMVFTALTAAPKLGPGSTATR